MPHGFGSGTCPPLDALPLNAEPFPVHVVNRERDLCWCRQLIRYPGFRVERIRVVGEQRRLLRNNQRSQQVLEIRNALSKGDRAVIRKACLRNPRFYCRRVNASCRELQARRRPWFYLFPAPRG